jgi:hypothetical protein
MRIIIETGIDNKIFDRDMFSVRPDNINVRHIFCMSEEIIVQIQPDNYVLYESTEPNPKYRTVYIVKTDDKFSQDWYEKRGYTRLFTVYQPIGATS